MARIPESELERLKAEVSLLRLVEAKGIALAKQGKDWVARCPFHEEATPSLVVSPAKNLFHCFGCGAAGGPIDWVMKLDGVSFRHAVELLRNDLPHLSLAVASETPPKPLRCSTVPKLASPLTGDADGATLLQEVADYYHQTLQASPEALAYLEARGLHHPELIATFRLGYANRSLAYRLPQKNRQAGAELRGRLQSLGVLRASGHEHLNGSLVVPLCDANGEVVQLYGRKINDNLRNGTAYHLYLPGPQRGVWNRAGIASSPEVILCEALLDAMTFWVHGFRNVTTAYGVNGVTDELLSALTEHGVRKVWIAFDRDAAGDTGADKLAVQLNALGIDAFRVRFPKGMDANEYAVKVGPAAKSLDLALRNAEWIGNGQRPEPSWVPLAVVQNGDHLDDDDGAIACPASSLVAAVADAAAPVVAVVEVAADVSEHEVNLTFGPRQYRVRGLSKQLSYEVLKVNVLVREGGAFHVDTLDLYSAKGRAAFLRQAGQELGVSEAVLKSDLGAVLLKLEELQDQLIRGVLTKQDRQPVMSDAEVKAALAWLKSPTLMTQVLADYAACGVVGEEANKQVAYLAAVSRLLDRPLAVLVQSSSAAGKSSLMEAVLRFVPEEARLQYSAMTGQSLFYLGEQDLQHKILAISEEEGAHTASYALKLLQSEGEVSIASTGKNAVTGNLETQTYRVKGPVMLFSTTTAIDLDEELLNRCLVLAVDESQAQTQAIHAVQRSRRTLAGLRAGAERERIVALHQNAQRLLRPLKVVNPFAERLTFGSDRTRMRRDHEKYLALIDAIALLHQYQREVKREAVRDAVIEYVEVTAADIALANQLAHAVLGRTLDELPPQTRKLLGLIGAWVTTQCADHGERAHAFRFTRRQVREATGWGNTQLKVHLGRLAEMEYLAVHAVRGNGFVYTLRFDGDIDHDGPQWMGLIDAAALHALERSGETARRSAPGRGAVGAVSAGGRSVCSAEMADKTAVEGELPSEQSAAHHVLSSALHRSRSAGGSSLAAAAVDG